MEDDWSGFGKSAFKPDPAWGKPFITDKVYDCGTCQSAVMVDEDACCVSCGQYMTEAEGDVVNKMILMD